MPYKQAIVGSNPTGATKTFGMKMKEWFEWKKRVDPEFIIPPEEQWEEIKERMYREWEDERQEMERRIQRERDDWDGRRSYEVPCC